MGLPSPPAMTTLTVALFPPPRLPLSREEKQQQEPGPWVHTSALLMTSSVTLGMSHDISLPEQFADLGHGDSKGAYLMGGKGRIE